MFIRLHRVFFNTPDSGGGGGAPENGGNPPEGGADFLSQLPEDIRGDTAFKDIKDLSGLAKSYVNAQRLIGYDRIPIPGENAKPEDWDVVYNRLGRPAKPEEYKLPPVKEGSPFQPPKELVTGFMGEAHKLGLTQKQAEGLFSWYTSQGDASITKINQDAETFRNEGLKALQNEFGAAFEQKIALAKDAIKSLADDDFREYLDESRLGDHPAMIRMFAKIGEMLAEDGTLKGSSVNSSVMTPDEAKARIAEFNANPEKLKAFMDSSHPNHKAAVEERTRLYSFAFPEMKNG